MTTYGPPAPRRQGTRPGRVVAIVAAVFLLLIGACLAIAGVALMAVFGTSGEVSTAKAPVTTPTAAVVTDITEIRNTSDVADALGTPISKFAADGGNASGLFLGIGPATEVDRFLSGVAIDQVVDLNLDPYSLDMSRRDGPQAAASPPADQNFWVASASGTGGLDLSWRVQDGDYRVVLMNVDGAAGVQSQLSIGVGLSGMFGLAVGLLIGGVVVIGLAILLLVLTRARPSYADGYVRQQGYGPRAGYGPPAGYGPQSTPPTGTPQPAGYGTAPPPGYDAPAGDGPPVASPTGYVPQSENGPRAGAMPPASPPTGTPLPAGYPPPAGYGPPVSPPAAYPPPAGNPAGYAPRSGELPQFADPPAGPTPPADPAPPVREPLP